MKVLRHFCVAIIFDVLFFLLQGPLNFFFFFFFLFIDRHLALIFYYFFQYTVFVCKFRPQESQSDVLGDLRRMISFVVGPYFEMPSLLLPGLELATPGTLTVLTRVLCLSLKPDVDREVRSHPE